MKIKKIVLLLFLFLPASVFCRVKLPKLISDGMVLQRNADVRIWGWASAGEKITIHFINATYLTTADDKGEWNDIPPVDKKDVGFRPALAAEKVACGEKNIVYSRPIYKSMKAEGNKIILSFENKGRGLIAKNGGMPASPSGRLKCFQICGRDDEFYPAEAEIVNNNVVLRSDKVKEPVAARYAWSNNPEGANLYNKEGPPASPFRTSDLYRGFK